MDIKIGRPMGLINDETGFDKENQISPTKRGKTDESLFEEKEKEISAQNVFLSSFETRCRHDDDDDVENESQTKVGNKTLFHNQIKFNFQLMVIFEVNRVNDAS